MGSGPPPSIARSPIADRFSFMPPSVLGLTSGGMVLGDPIVISGKVQSGQLRSNLDFSTEVHEAAGDYQRHEVVFHAYGYGTYDKWPREQ